MRMQYLKRDHRLYLPERLNKDRYTQHVKHESFAYKQRVLETSFAKI